MGAATEGAEIVRLSKEHAELKPVADAVLAVARAREELPELEEMAKAGDPEMASLAQDELQALNERLPGLEHEVALLLAPKDRDENASAILEVRAGTGGDEAALFAGDLFRMYQRYAQSRGWRVEIDSISEGEVGGYKEIIASITGEGVFGRLKFESGVHRVQRVPETEAGGRIHTSAATVAVLPEVEEVSEVEIKPEELRIDLFCASGPGGQKVNKTESAIRITHLPTGIVVACQDERSQNRNRDKAMKVLASKLLDLRRQQDHDKMANERKSQIGSGDRSERIRTYNFPQNRLTDHRINLTLYSLDQIMEGKLDDVIGALQSKDIELRLAEQMGTAHR